MIIPSTKKLLFVPDFGISAEDEAMVSLKNTIESRLHFSVKIIDVRQMVLDAHTGEQLEDTVEIEMCARQLESLAVDESLAWDYSAYEDFEDPVHAYCKENFKDIFKDAKEVEVSSCRIKKSPVRRLRITKTVTDGKERQAPDVVVVFGKSAMLAGGIKDKPVLFVNPVYDSEL